MQLQYSTNCSATGLTNIFSIHRIIREEYRNSASFYLHYTTAFSRYSYISTSLSGFRKKRVMASPLERAKLRIQAKRDSENHLTHAGIKPSSNIPLSENPLLLSQNQLSSPLNSNPQIYSSASLFESPINSGTRLNSMNAVNVTK